MKSIIGILCLFIIYPSLSFGQQINLQSYYPTQDNTFKFNQDKKTFFEKEAVQIAFVPTLLLSASLLSWDNKKDIREIRNRYIPTFQYKYDDLLQYLPAATTFGLKATGVKGRNDFNRSAISYGISMVIMGILINSIKYTTKVERPDGSSKNSFPSGHTAMAFANATFLDKEYGLVNPIYPIGGYGTATMTGLGRSLNNRHWVPDILAGAGIGILSTQLAYFFVDKVYGNKGDNLSFISKFESNENPSFLSLKLGYASGLESLVKTKKEGSLVKLGWEAGIEGAYFFNKHWGIGSQFVLASFPFADEHIHIAEEQNLNAKILSQSMGNLTFSVGPYYALHFSDKWNLMLKSLGGYSISADGAIELKMLSEHSTPWDEKDQLIELASYKASNTFKFTGGIALTYNITDNLGTTIYSDFNHSQSKVIYSINPLFLEENDSQVSIVKAPFNYISAGIRLTAYF